MAKGNYSLTGHSCGHTSEHEPTTCPKCVARLEADLKALNSHLDASLDSQEQLEVQNEAMAAALRKPGPNVLGCDCDRGGDADSPLCEMHKKRFEPLRWETLAFMVVDLEAYAVAARAALSPDAGKGWQRGAAGRRWPDAGKGWVSPEVAEQVLGALEVARSWIGSQETSDPAKPSILEEIGAALDALKEVER